MEAAALWPGPIAWTATTVLALLVTGHNGGAALHHGADDPCDAGRPDSSLLHCFATHAFADSASTLASVNLGFNALFIGSYALISAACGRLRPNEREQLRQNSLDFALFKLVFIPIIIEPALEDFAAWLAWFAVMGQLKVLTTLARERIKFLGSALPGSVDRRGCARVVGLLLTITVSMAVGAWVCIGMAGEIGWQLVLIMLFDCVCIALELAKAAADCSAHVHERMGDDACGASFERCSTNKYYALFALDTTASVSRLAHYGQVWTMHGVSFSLVDLMLFILARHCATKLCESTSAMLSYRHTMRTLDTLFPTVDGGHMGGTGDGSDDTCVICHEIMNRMKQLPCGHCFHGACLRGWLERGSSTCPICRAAVVSGDPARTPQTEGTQTVAPAPAVAVAGLQAATGQALGAFDGAGNGNAAAGGGTDTSLSWLRHLDFLPSLSIERERTGNADAPAAFNDGAAEAGDGVAGFADGWLALLGLDFTTVRAWLPVLSIEIRTGPTNDDLVNNDAIAGATSIAAQNEENRDEQTSMRQEVAMMQQQLQMQQAMQQQQQQQQQHRMQQNGERRQASATVGTRRLRPTGWSASAGGSAGGSAEEAESSPSR